MTGTRNKILLTGLLFSLILLILLSLSDFTIFKAKITSELNKSMTSQYFWFIYNKAPSNMFFYFPFIIGITVLSFSSFFGGIFFRRLFIRIASSEVFFFAIFLFSLSFESFRLFNLLIMLYNLPEYIGLICTRIIYFGRIFSHIALLLSSLYAIEFKYDKYGIIIIGIFIASFIFAYSVPTDSSVFLSQLLYKLGDELGIFIILTAIKLFTIINFFIAAFIRQGNFLYIAFSIIFIIIGIELIIFIIGIIPLICAFVLLLIGIILFYKNIYKVYRWY